MRRHAVVLAGALVLATSAYAGDGIEPDLRVCAIAPIAQRHPDNYWTAGDGCILNHAEQQQPFDADIWQRALAEANYNQRLARSIAGERQAQREGQHLKVDISQH
ncbi:hypothetical protein AS156_25790 [Bradyrhizobium macuxiense]|uniref:Uncharacterized protein n=1 Tax=Bradyrhizobium macuxiense TaxID=1755647 RepID=A0A125QAN7_9BRAD|nr:hypothetical protein AS156_25790 [Bradyrhizobium macuxiense]